MLNHRKFFAEKIPILKQRMCDLYELSLIESGLKELSLLPGSMNVRGNEIELCFEFITEVEKKLEQKTKFTEFVVHKANSLNSLNYKKTPTNRPAGGSSFFG